MTATTTDRERRPVRARPRLGLEQRAPFELALLVAAGPALALLPRGDGHPVLVVPGLAASDRSTFALRALVTRWGYPAYGWGLGRNAGRADGLADRLHEVVVRHGRPATVIGQSLGGVFARELARRHREQVRQVISLASPFRTVNPQPPPVPTTAIYSRTDGVVPWQACVDEPSADHENVEVDTSHIGMGVHPAVMVVVARRLARRFTA